LRFTTLDKASQLTDGFNYCANDPFGSIDKDGNFAFLLGIAAAMFQGAAFSAMAYTVVGLPASGFDFENWAYGFDDAILGGAIGGGVAAGISLLPGLKAMRVCIILIFWLIIIMAGACSWLIPIGAMESNPQYLVFDENYTFLDSNIEMEILGHGYLGEGLGYVFNLNLGLKAKVKTSKVSINPNNIKMLFEDIIMEPSSGGDDFYTGELALNKKYEYHMRFTCKPVVYQLDTVTYNRHNRAQVKMAMDSFLFVNNQPLQIDTIKAIDNTAQRRLNEITEYKSIH